MVLICHRVCMAAMTHTCLCQTMTQPCSCSVPTHVHVVVCSYAPPDRARRTSLSTDFSFGVSEDSRTPNPGLPPLPSQERLKQQQLMRQQFIEQQQAERRRSSSQTLSDQQWDPRAGGEGPPVRQNSASSMAADKSHQLHSAPIRFCICSSPHVVTMLTVTMIAESKRYGNGLLSWQVLSGSDWLGGGNEAAGSCTCVPHHHSLTSKVSSQEVLAWSLQRQERNCQLISNGDLWPITKCASPIHERVPECCHRAAIAVTTQPARC